MNFTHTELPDSEKNHWVFQILPDALVPYAQLMRLDRPAGWWLLLLPCWITLSIAAIYLDVPAYMFWREYILFFIGAVVMRSAGCVYNDIADRNIDAQVERTRSRPIPSGRVSVKSAFILLALLLLAGLMVLISFDIDTILVTTASLIIVAIYPFAKRFTRWPQVFLGLAFNWGVWSAWMASVGYLTLLPAVLYIALIAWTIGYDTIYAHQDKKDDISAGVKSTALLFGDRSRQIISVFYGFIAASLGFLVIILSDLRPMNVVVSMILILTTISGALHLLWQIRVVDFDTPESCRDIFRSNKNFGIILTFGFALASVM